MLLKSRVPGPCDAASAGSGASWYSASCKIVELFAVFVPGRRPNSVHTIVLDVGRKYSCPSQLRAFQPWDFARMVWRGCFTLTFISVYPLIGAPWPFMGLSVLRRRPDRARLSVYPLMGPGRPNLAQLSVCRCIGISAQSPKVKAGSATTFHVYTNYVHVSKTHRIFFCILHNVHTWILIVSMHAYCRIHNVCFLSLYWKCLTSQILHGQQIHPCLDRDTFRTWQRCATSWRLVSQTLVLVMGAWCCLSVCCEWFS